MPEVSTLKATKFETGIDLHRPQCRVTVLPSCLAFLYTFYGCSRAALSSSDQ